MAPAVILRACSPSPRQFQTARHGPRQGEREARRIAQFLERPEHPLLAGTVRVVPVQKRSTSVINKYSVKVECNGSTRWICFAGKCGDAGGTHLKTAETVTSNATAHLAPSTV